MSGTSHYVNRWSFEDGATPSFDSGSDSWDFLSGSDLVADVPLLNGSGLTGGVNEDVSRTRFGPSSVIGTLTAEPSPAFFGSWLPRAMGGGTATSPTLEDAPAVWGCLADCGVDVFDFLGNVVNVMRVSGNAGGMISCGMDVIGLTEGQNVANWVGAALGSTLAYEPFTHSDMALTLVSGARTVKRFEFVLNNGFQATFGNSTTPIHIARKAKRQITLNALVAVSSGDISALYGQSKNGAAGSLVLTNATCSTTFSFSRVQLPNRRPRTEDGEIVIPIQAQIRGTGWADEFTVTNDMTP